MVDLSEYKYLTEIQGAKLSNIKLGESIIPDLVVDFKVNLKENYFDFSTENLSNAQINSLYNYHIKVIIVDEARYIYCIDENNIPFTIYDCMIHPLSNKVIETMRITWNSIVFGQHISNIDDCHVNELQCVVEDMRESYTKKIRNATYNIEKGSIAVKTSWSYLPCEGLKVPNGVLFELTSNQPIELEKMRESFNRSLEVYFLWIGHFPEIKDMRFYNEEGEFVYINNSKGLHYSTKINVNKSRQLLFKDLGDYSLQYDKWVKRREKILFAINYIDHTKRVFDYESSNKLPTGKTKLGEFVTTCVKHRNFISHLSSPKDYFNTFQENEKAQKKLSLLLRLCFLHDIGLAIDDQCLDNYVNEIDKKFCENKSEIDPS